MVTDIAPIALLLSQIIKSPGALGPRAALCGRLEALGVPAVSGAWLATARLAARRGQFAVALALTLRKLNGGAQGSMLRELSERYGAERWRIGSRVPPPMPPARDLTVPGTMDACVELGLRLLSELDGLTLPDDALYPEVPLFSALPASHFVPLIRALREVTFQKGQILIRQGDTDRNLYLLAQGQVRVEATKPDGTVTELALALAPALLGEISVLTAVPRRASVVAMEPVLAWRLEGASLDRLSASQPDLRAHVETIVKRRLLANVLRTSRLFAQTGVPDALVPAFRLRPVSAGEEVFPQGAPSPGLFVVLHGSAEVWARAQDETRTLVRVAMLAEGDAFGEFSLLTGQPTTAAVRMPEGGVLLHLAPKDFAALRDKLGRLETGLSELMDVRRGELRDLVDPGTEGSEGFEQIDEAWLLAE